jgi:hypothetical protein
LTSNSNTNARKNTLKVVVSMAPSIYKIIVSALFVTQRLQKLDGSAWSVAKETELAYLNALIKSVKERPKVLCFSISKDLEIRTTLIRPLRSKFRFHPSKRILAPILV